LEITVLYFKRCGRESSVLRSQIEFIHRRVAKLGARIFATVKNLWHISKIQTHA